MSSNEQRRAATDQYARGIDAINACSIGSTISQPPGQGSPRVAAGAGDGDDPVRAAEAVLEAAGVVGEALAALRTAGAVAVEYRSKAELAGDVGTRPTLLFPRQGAPDAARGVDSHGGAESVTS